MHIFNVASLMRIVTKSPERFREILNMSAEDVRRMSQDDKEMLRLQIDILEGAALKTMQKIKELRSAL